jgi:hypothetical protein
MEDSREHDAEQSVSKQFLEILKQINLCSLLGNSVPQSEFLM